MESDSMSNFSSHSSTVSSETRQETMPLLEIKQFKMVIAPEEFEKYNKVKIAHRIRVFSVAQK